MSQDHETAYAADSSIRGKIRRRLARMSHRRPVRRSAGRPLLTISFDDAPLTATSLGAEILNRRGIKGTYYASAGLSGRRQPMGVCAGPEDYVRLAAQGHEIACHTFSHLDCGKADGSRIREDVRRNAEAFAQWGLSRPSSFAYPYGDVSPASKSTLAPVFTSLRALHPGLVEAGSDLNQTPAVGIEGEDGPARALAWLETARARSAWLILYTHDVAEAPSPWGCTPSALEQILSAAQAQGFEFVTVRDGVARVAA